MLLILQWKSKDFRRKLGFKLETSLKALGIFLNLLSRWVNLEKKKEKMQRGSRIIEVIRNCLNLD